MKKQDLILKTIILVIAITVIVGGWFSLSTIDHQAAEIKGLKETKERQKAQISFLQNDNQKKTQDYEESEQQHIEETVNVFVQSVFNVQEDNYEERRSNVESVISQELYDKIFPNTEQKQMYVNDVGEIRVYSRVQGENASAFVVFNQTVKNLTNKENSKTQLTIEVFLNKEEENWVVNQFKQIN